MYGRPKKKDIQEIRESILTKVKETNARIPDAGIELLVELHRIAKFDYIQNLTTHWETYTRGKRLQVEITHRTGFEDSTWFSHYYAARGFTAPQPAGNNSYRVEAKGIELTIHNAIKPILRKSQRPIPDSRQLTFNI
jgi:hypothetical protein